MIKLTVIKMLNADDDCIEQDKYRLILFAAKVSFLRNAMIHAIINQYIFLMIVSAIHDNKLINMLACLL